MVEVLEISKHVLKRLSALGREKDIGYSNEQLLFPRKEQSRGVINRYSEQEVRLLFIEEFKKKHPELFYSIETPTFQKHRFGKSLEEIVLHQVNLEVLKQSALIDLCIFKRDNGVYNRILNIEFKFGNPNVKNFSKDVLKLIMEENDGVFLHMVKNTHKGTITQLMNKLYISFSQFSKLWKNPVNSIRLIIMSLEYKHGESNPVMIERLVTKDDITDSRINSTFLRDRKFVDLKSDQVYDGWNIVRL